MRLSLPEPIWLLCSIRRTRIFLTWTALAFTSRPSCPNCFVDVAGTAWMRQPTRICLSVGLSPAGWRHDSVHPQILHHLSVVIKCMRDGECRPVEAGRFTVLRILQHILTGQHS